MKILILRLLAGFLAVNAVLWALRNLRYVVQGKVNAANIGFAAFEIALCYGCAWFAVHGGRPEVSARIPRALRFGCIIGGVCFVAGYFGPIVFAPEANQGPLLGIFVTGPIGFVVGLLIGGLTAPAAPRK